MRSNSQYVIWDGLILLGNEEKWHVKAPPLNILYTIVDLCLPRDSRQLVNAGVSAEFTTVLLSNYQILLMECLHYTCMPTCTAPVCILHVISDYLYHLHVHVYIHFSSKLLPKKISIKKVDNKIVSTCTCTFYMTNLTWCKQSSWINFPRF